MTEEPEDQEFLERLLFRDLTESKVDIRSPCVRCEGRGNKNGQPCEVCEGERYVTQSVSLYALGKRLLPFFVHRIKTEMKAFEAATAGAPR